MIVCLELGASDVLNVRSCLVH